MGKEKPLVSVIIPVYNVQKYLEECVESVQSQSYTNLEIVLVDDGSTDNSGELCDEFALYIKVMEVSQMHGIQVCCRRGENILLFWMVMICFRIVP